MSGLIWLALPLVCLLVWWTNELNELWVGLVLAGLILQHLT